MDLFRGIAVAFDDEISSAGSRANEIASYIEGEGIPLLRYEHILKFPDNAFKSLRSASFILLDWRYSNEPNVPKDGDDVRGADDDIPIPVSNGSELQAEDDRDSAEFLLKLLAHTVCPIFVITTLTEDRVVDTIKLVRGLEFTLPSRVFICHKGDIGTKDQLKRMLESWLDENPSMYVFKTWDDAAISARNDLFRELECESTHWPSILWKGYEHEFDGVHSTDGNKSQELVGVLNSMVSNRIYLSCEFDSNKVIGTPIAADARVLRSVLEKERYLPFSDKNNGAPLAPGDLFLDDGRYYINLRAQCDTLRVPAPKAVLIPGDVVCQAQFSQNDIEYRQGQLIARDFEVVVPFVDHGKIIKFVLRDVRMKPADSKYMRKRIGRLLSPFVTRLQQLFAAYIVREGLPSVPQDIFSDAELPSSSQIRK